MSNIPKESRRAPEEASGAYDDGSEIDPNEVGEEEAPGEWAASPSFSDIEPLHIRRQRSDSFSSDIDWASAPQPSGVRGWGRRRLSTSSQATACPRAAEEPPAAQPPTQPCPTAPAPSPVSSPPVAPASSPVSPPPLLPLDVALPRWEPFAREWEEPVAGPSWATTPPRHDFPWDREAPPPLVTINREAFAAVMGLVAVQQPKRRGGRPRGSHNRGSDIPLPLKKRCTACQRRSRGDYKPRRNRYGLRAQRCWQCKVDLVYPDEQ